MYIQLLVRLEMRISLMHPQNHLQELVPQFACRNTPLQRVLVAVGVANLNQVVESVL